MKPLAQDHVLVCASPDPTRVFCYTPGIERLRSGRLVATTDWGGPGVAELEGAKAELRDCHKFWQGRIYTSDDRGATWRMRGTFPFMHARPFASGDSVYVLGQRGAVAIVRSDDDGVTWGEAADLTDGGRWHQSACNVLRASGNVYLVMERRVEYGVKAWAPAENAPVLMRAREGDDLTRRSSWTFASELPFREAVDESSLSYIAVPFYDVDPVTGANVGGPGRHCAPMGWLETNVVRFTDPGHIWHDPEGHTFHLWMRAHTGGTGYACVAKVIENADGSMSTSLQRAPSGRSVVYVPCPGGQMRFHVLQDDQTGLYWLLSTQATDSMRRPDALPPDRYNLPNNERRRLQLHFSRNMIDWCFAGMVAIGPVERASRHYASMVIDGDDLCVLSRSGDERAKSAHDGNLITFHRVRNFRSLVY